MLISVVPGEECRIALMLDGRLEELFIERASSESHVGNIYKGRVTNVEPSIQAAFVDFGLHKNGFLHISDVVPHYFPDHNGEPEDIGRKTPRRDRPPVQSCLRRGQEVIVQITKEGIGTKGPTLSTYISVPGRFLVMMPGMSRLGVSRKIEEDDDRHKMRDMLSQLTLPKGMGFILRTAGLNRTKRELQRDLNYLARLWKTVTDLIKNERAPATLYQESDLAIRTVRDTLETDVERIVIDDEATAQKVQDFLSIAMPRATEKVRLYSDPLPLFYRYRIEEEIEKLHNRYVPLPSGGSLVIESTEALVAIDVNSGKYREQADAEETARRTNLEAAEEIARQLRLRDLGGLIVCDFIDMRMEKHRRQVEKALRDALKRHKERAKILRMSRFGIIEMTRQRTRPSISRSMHQDCPYCRGTGLIKTPESTTLDAMRMLQLAIHREAISQIEIHVCPDAAFELQNRKRRAIHEFEAQSGKRVVVRAADHFAPGQLEYVCKDARGRPVKFP
ncbi:MAG: Rne/Rng family ribonuclease [Phycisphaerae bacterium]|nr:Rne/Rng family ribonuclease [Phycisphaerae bacterium]